jgi:hypothetical protein
MVVAFGPADACAVRLSITADMVIAQSVNCSKFGR